MKKKLDYQSTTEQKTCIWSILSIIFAFLIPLLGILFSIIALVKIKNESNLKGKGLAIAGLIVGGILLIPAFSILSLYLAAYIDPEVVLEEGCIISRSMPGISCLDFEVKADGATWIRLQNNLDDDFTSVTLTIENECSPALIDWKDNEMIKLTCLGSGGEKGEKYRKDVSIVYTTSNGKEHTLRGKIFGKYV